MQEDLRRWYVDERLTAQEIGTKVGKSKRTIVRLLHKFSIPVRPPGPERHDQLRDPKWLRHQYVDLGKSTTDIANDLGTQATLVSYWLKRNDVAARARGCHEPYARTPTHRAATAARGRLYVGTANPNYKGGPDRENKSLRTSYKAKSWSKQVRERDNWTCVDCGGAGRHAHHLQSWKTHPELRFDLSNGVTVCVPCHERRHGRIFPEWVHQKAENTTSANPLYRG